MMNCGMVHLALLFTCLLIKKPNEELAKQFDAEFAAENEKKGLSLDEHVLSRC